MDVRSFPKSKWPEFEKENLEKNLPERSLEYFHLESLGGYRNGGYEKYMETDDFQAGLSELEALARESRTVIMCLKSYPSGCHRRFISKRLKGKGWKVFHLVGKKGKQKTLG